MALLAPLQHNFITSLEARFFPDTNCRKFYNTVKKYWLISNKKNTMLYRLISNVQNSLPLGQLNEVLHNLSPAEKTETKMTDKLFFVPFLVKKPDNCKNELKLRRKLKVPTIYGRHFYLRNGEYFKQIRNIEKLRQLDKPFTQTIYGIDACNNEVNAPPEVFAYLFRKARHSSAIIPQFFGDTLSGAPKKLRITYHVGEDFFDIASGLRAIDEAILFLELSHGDRLGHALALGIEPPDFYDLKNSRLFIPRQELLDNLAWLWHSMRKYGLFDSIVEAWINDNTGIHFQKLYRAEIPFSDSNHTISTHAYVNGWHLRGDHPKYYKNINEEKVYLRKIELQSRMTPWELLKTPHVKDIRNRDSQARQLMHLYHFNANIRLKGKEIVELDIPEGYVEIIRLLQNKMIANISNLGIGIETNPSSNYLIGTFRKYHKHPIVRFYDRWIKPNSTSPKAFVSINTDDLGVFDTDLENEYALMASALINAKDEYGHSLYNESDIIRWLDDIRQMGLEQSFMLTHKYTTEGR